jgi:hypothetical protein
MRGVAIRSIAASLAMVFAFVTEAPAFGSRCPVHDPALAALSTGSGHAHRVASSEAADHHSARLHSHGLPGTGDQHQQKSHGCTCVGCSSCPSPVTVAAAALSFTPATVSVGTTTPLPPMEKHACSTSEHALPFSTAPPQA